MPFTKVLLADVREVEYNDAGYLAESGDGKRHFRTTEIHLTFRKLSMVHPAIIFELLKSGFYSAFQPAEGNNLKFIATLQGFHREISHLYNHLLDWMTLHHGMISCGVTVKREDILSFFVFGRYPKVQQVLAVN